VERFSLDDVAPPDLPGRWEQLVSDTHVGVTVWIPPGPDRFRGRVRRQWIDDLALVDCVCDPCAGVRGRTRIAAADQDLVAVLLIGRGHEQVSQGDLTADLRPGGAVFWDSARPVRFAVRQPLTKRTLVLPRAALHEVIGRSWDAGGMALDGSAPATLLLAGYLDLLARTLPTLGPAAVTAARNATLELVAGTLRPPDAVGGAVPAPALRATMEAWIDRNLRAELTPAAIAAAHSVSVRTVHRTFASAGQTVGEVVRVRRLARARGELAARGEPISVIARRWGFADSSHFTRAFRTHYGTTPSDYRASTRDAEPHGARP
jgi:AraC family transcriptional regulator, positive regulator of tynA and feaB